MIQAPNELRDVAAGATVNLFVSVGQTSRRLKGTVSTTRERGTSDEVLEVHVDESAPGASEIVFWLGFNDEETYLLPLDDEDEALVYVKYKHSGGQTGLYIDSVREVGVRPPSKESQTPSSEESTPFEERKSSDDAEPPGETTPSEDARTTEQARVGDRPPRSEWNTLR